MLSESICDIYCDILPGIPFDTLSGSAGQHIFPVQMAISGQYKSLISYTIAYVGLYPIISYTTPAFISPKRMIESSCEDDVVQLLENIRKQATYPLISRESNH